MKQVTTITLTFKLHHKSGEKDIHCIRNLLSWFREYNDAGSAELVTNDDTNDYTFINHEGQYSRQFTFNTIDAFVRKYAKFDAASIANTLSEYGRFVECDSKTEEVEDEN